MRPLINFKNWLPYWLVELVKILIWSAGLYFLKRSDYNIFLLLLYLGLSGYIFFVPRARLIFTHLVLFILAPLTLSLVNSQTNILLAVGYFGITLFILNLAKNPIFLARALIYKIGFTAVFLAIFIVFFISGIAQNFIFKELMIFLVAIFLFLEFLKESTPLTPRRRLLFSLIFGLILIECLWAVSLLPIGFINSSVFLTLIIYLIANFLLEHLKGTLNRRKILEHFTIFIILILFIFGLSKWTI